MKVFEGVEITNHCGKSVPIKSWCNELEPGAKQQAMVLSALPFVYKHVALMPDCHQGYGMPIGGVIATHGVVIPNCVGVDIGCGMLAVKTTLPSISLAHIKKIMGVIRKTVPVGFRHNSEDQEGMPDFNDAQMTPIVMREFSSARRQLGTLGGGNHFIEIQKGKDGVIWFMVHSGSRNVGHKVAEHYNEKAKYFNFKWYSIVPSADDLAFLPLDDQMGQDYIAEMNYCLDFAQANRDLIAERVKAAFVDVVGNSADFCEAINIHHNYARMEHHFKKNVMIHRKGATSAMKGEVGIIPGSQGAPSYIVEGVGSQDSFFSCSHGAGRKMGRKAACKDLNFEEEVKELEDQGIIHSLRSKSDLDEAPGAYKNINTVMFEQTDLVNVQEKLTPLAVIKG